MLVRNTCNLFLKYKLYYIPMKFFMDFDPKKDYYKILGVSPNASEKEIKIAYYKMAKLHHPDLNAGKQNNEFKEMTNAYDILSDPKKKEEYDSLRKGGFGAEDNFYNNFYNRASQNGNYNKTNKTTYQQNSTNNDNQDDAFKNKFKNSQFYTRYDFKDPKTGKWKSYNSTEGNPFFKDFEDFFRKAQQNTNQQNSQNQQYYYDDNLNKNKTNDYFRNYWERNKFYDQRFWNKSQKYNDDDINNPNRFKNGYNPFEQNPNYNQYNPNQDFNYDYSPFLFYQFLRRMFIFLGLFLFFSLIFRRRVNQDYYFSNGYGPNYTYSQYPNPHGAYIPGSIPRAVSDEFDPYDPRSDIKIK